MSTKQAKMDSGKEPTIVKKMQSRLWSNETCTDACRMRWKYFPSSFAFEEQSEQATRVHKPT
jgi:hypothetical protein